jgi:hypothetical protein
MTARDRPIGVPAAEAVPMVLLALLMGIYIVFGVVAGGLGMLGVAGAVVVGLAVALRHRSRPAAVTVLVIGAVPFAVAVAWSVVVPITGLLILGVGVPFLWFGSQRTASGTEAA